MRYTALLEAVMAQFPQWAELDLNFADTSAWSTRLLHNRTGSALVLGPSGTFEWAPENLLLNSATLATQNITTVAASYTLTFYGTGTVTLSGTSTAGPLVGTGASDRVSLTFPATAGTLTVTVSGSVTTARLQRGSISRSADDTYLVTTSAARYLQRRTYDTSAGVLTTTLGSELVTNGSFASDTAWTKGTGWSIAAGVASFTATGSTSDLTSTGLTLTAGGIYAVVATITRSAGTITVNCSGATYDISASGTYTLYLTATSASSFKFTAGTTFTGTVDDVSVKLATTTQTGTVTTLGYLGEEQRTNVATSSAAIDTSTTYWGGTSFFSAIRPALSVLDGQTAWKHFGNGTSNSYRRQASQTTMSTSTAYCFSAVLENPVSNGVAVTTFKLRDESGAADVGVATYTWATSTLALDSGTVTNLRVEALGTGPNGGTLVRISGSATTTTGANQRWYIYPQGTGNVSFDMIVHHLQIEAGTFATSPIITTTASATRAADTMTVRTGRTNFLLQSQTLNTTWTKTNVTVTEDTVAAPDATSTADKVEATASAATTFSQTVNSSGARTLAGGNCFSIYAKQGSGATDANAFKLRDSTTSTDLLSITVNYGTGAITYVTGSSGATVTDAGSGWWRISLAAPAANNGNNIICYAGFVGGSETAGEYAYLWGGQLEIGSVPSAYIATTTAAVTVNDQWFNESQGTLVVDALASGVISGGVLASINDGTAATECLRLLADTTDPRWQVYDGGVQQVNVDAGTITANTAFRIAARYAVNDYAASFNGAAVGTDTAGTLPTVDRLTVGAAGNATAYVNTPIKRIRYWRRALTNGELVALSTL